MCWCTGRPFLRGAFLYMFDKHVLLSRCARWRRTEDGTDTFFFFCFFSLRVECEVIEYGEVEGAMRGLHRVRFADGLCEWIALKRFRLVMSAKRFARAIGLKKATHELDCGCRNETHGSQ